MMINATSALQNLEAIQSALAVLTVLEITAFKYPEQACVHDNESYDYIIIGGGTAGCVIATRLAEDNDKSVLLIEAGGNPKGESDIPALLLYLKRSSAAWNFTIEDKRHEQYQRPLKDDMSLGRLLGGTSSNGYLLYYTGNCQDYDNWAAIVNDTTWSCKNIQPYLHKSQKLVDPVLLNSGGRELFGTDGKIGLSLSRKKIGEEFFTAFEQMGNKRIPVINENVAQGYADALFTLDKGLRQSTAFSYLTPDKNKTNLHILKHTSVKKIIFDADKNAVGVEVETCKNKTITLKSRIEIILSAGIVNSPKLLMLSGVGPKEHLDKHNIETIANLPVGKNLQDHLSVVVVFNMTKLVVPFRPWNSTEYPAAVIVGFESMNKTDTYPDYHTVNFINYPIFLMMYCTFTYSYVNEVCDSLIKTDVNSVMMYSVINKLKFKSRGTIQLRSKDFRDPPLIYCAYYDEEDDLEDHAKAVEHFVEIGKTEQFKKWGGVFKDPELDLCEDFELYSREYWKCYVRYMKTSLHNYSSTCAMGSVVDSRLRVYGVKKLRVADASVMPSPTAGGTLGATIMIAEKVSDMIKEDNKLER